MKLIKLTNSNNMQVTLSDWGASVYSIKIPYRNSFKEIVLGSASEEEFVSDKNPCFGATVGRVANRIEGATFFLEGKQYFLQKNEGSNNNHSGPSGYHNRLWQIKKVTDQEVTFALESEDMDQGYPGRVAVETKYSLNARNQLMIEFSGIPDKTTLLNLTNHCYFNLGGHDSGDILEHELVIDADYYYPCVDESWIPSKNRCRVENTPLDFTKAKQIGRDIDCNHPDMNIRKDYNHCFILNKAKYYGASAYCPRTGISLKLMTNYPCVLLYTAGYMNGLAGRDGAKYGPHAGFCLEAQYAPNAINNSKEAMVPIVKAGQRYCKKVIYEFKW